jgi:hypothetical protein
MPSVINIIVHANHVAMQLNFIKTLLTHHSCHITPYNEELTALNLNCTLHCHNEGKYMLLMVLYFMLGLG